VTARALLSPLRALILYLIASVSRLAAADLLMPVQDPVEMHLSLDEAELRTGIPREKMSKALEQFLLTLVSADSKFDRVTAGEETFTESEARGFTLFHTEYDPRRASAARIASITTAGLVPEQAVRQQRLGRRAEGPRARRRHR
jgi:hypothetical protein